MELKDKMAAAAVLAAPLIAQLASTGRRVDAENIKEALDTALTAVSSLVDERAQKATAGIFE